MFYNNIQIGIGKFGGPKMVNMYGQDANEQTPKPIPPISESRD